MFRNAVFQGGGIKGIALVGALQRVEESGVKFKAVGGTSAGSIVAALYAAGYSAPEMKALLDATAFDKLLGKLRLPGWGFLKNKGLHSTDRFYEWMFEQLQKKGVRTFEDLTEIDLKIVGSDLTNKEIIIFDRTNSAKMNIAEAVRMSISIPLFFQPYRLGEKLVVDGGILSNYPLFIFDNPSETVGFKLVGKTTVVPAAPTSWLGYLFAIANTMMESHDKEDERQAGHENTIHIDNAGIPTTKFDLTDAERSLLFQNGYYAASQFLNKNVEVLRDINKETIKIEAPFSEPLIVHSPGNLNRDELIRVSISGLISIYIDGMYLLVKGKRIDQFQPVGGVFKRLPNASNYLKELGVLDDDKLPIDEASRDDLRIRVPLETLPTFLEWYRKESGREVSPWREFREELVDTGILSATDFRFIYYERMKTHVNGIQFSSYFNCYELLIAEIYELSLIDKQTEALRGLIQEPNENYLWCDRKLILSKGFDDSKKVEVARISETAKWIL